MKETCRILRRLTQKLLDSHKDADKSELRHRKQLLCLWRFNKIGYFSLEISCSTQLNFVLKYRDCKMFKVNITHETKQKKKEIERKTRALSSPNQVNSFFFCRPS